MLGVLPKDSHWYSMWCLPRQGLNPSLQHRRQRCYPLQVKNTDNVEVYVLKSVTLCYIENLIVKININEQVQGKNVFNEEYEGILKCIKNKVIKIDNNNNDTKEV